MTEDERAIRNLVDTWMSATRAGDIEELKVLGKWAYLRNYIDMTITPQQGAPAHRAGYTLTILRKEEDGRWVVARDANLVA